MMTIENKTLLEQLHWRYAVKQFDASQKIDDATWEALEQALVLSPSSYGLQPWKFFVITDQALKDQMPAISWNQGQPRDCSHMVVLAAKKSLDATYVQEYMDHIVATRQLEAGAMDGYRNVLVKTVEGRDDHLDWNARQVYIALGQLMVAAAMLGVDTCPMEGIQPAAYDELLGLSDGEFTSVVGCACGYRSEEDPGATNAKVRFPTERIIARV
ncbi:MAG: NAD(P)H-dependent oxidoreductase [Planctomycetota bacterium]